jgi:hypothetical protein
MEIWINDLKQRNGKSGKFHFHQLIFNRIINDKSLHLLNLKIREKLLKLNEIL